MGTTEAVPEPRVDLDMGIRAVELESLGCARWSGIKFLNQMLKALLGAMKALLGVAKVLIRARWYGLAMATK